MDTEETPSVSYFQPRIMAHRRADGKEYAIHDVYFNENGHIEGYTVQARSPRETSIEKLRQNLMALMNQDAEEFILGDLGYSYSKDDIQFWLEFIEYPPLDHVEEDE